MCSKSLQHYHSNTIVLHAMDRHRMSMGACVISSSIQCYIMVVLMLDQIRKSNKLFQIQIRFLMADSTW